MGFVLWDKVASFFKKRNIAVPERTIKQQGDLNKLSGVSMIGTNQFVIEQTNLSLNRLQRYRDYSQMDNVGEISLALDLFADESSLVDPELKQTIIIKSKYARVKKELEHLFYNILNINQTIRSVARYLCKYGDFAWELIPSQNRNSLAGIKFINIYNFTRIETKYGDLVGFYYQDNVDTQPQFLDPWQCSHMRLTSFENIFYPYGRSILEPARKSFKQLRLMEDSAIVYRLCLTGDTYIWTSNGHKMIKDIEPDDHIYSYNGASGELIDNIVVEKNDNGKDEIWEIKSEHYTLYGNKTHPVLVRNKSTQVIQYIDIQDLDRSYHQVIAPIRNKGVDFKLRLPDIHITKKLVRPYHCLTKQRFDIERELGYFPEEFFDTKESIDLNIYKKISKVIPNLKVIDIHGEDYKGIRINRELDEDIMRFLGYFSINMYINRCNDDIVIGIDDKKPEYAEKFKQYFYKYSTYELENRTVFAYVEQPQLNKIVQFMLLNDFSLNNTRYRIPQWVFTVSLELREAYLKGLIDSRICHKEGSIYMFQANDFMLKTLKDFLLEMGYDITVTNNKIATEFNKRSIYEDIISIKRLVKKQEIYDITVSSEHHNFIANGIVVHNTRAPEKRVITIPVGDIPASEVDEYMVQQARRFKKRNYMDLGFNDVSSRWNPMIAQDDYFLPQRPDGVGPTITTLAGAENLDKIEDIEYFKKKMISALKIPFNRVGIGEQPNDAQQSLSQVAPEFAKSVQWIQREMISGLKKIAFVHLALKRFNEDEIRNFDINMTASSAIDELYRIETWSSRAGVIRDLLASGLPMEYVFKRFTDLSDDEIEKIKNQQQQQQQQGGAENPLGAMGESLEKLKFKFLNREEPAEINTENDYENYIINNELGDIPIDDNLLLTEDIVDKDEINYLKEQALKYLEEEYQEYIEELKQDYYYKVLHQDDEDEDEITEKDIPI